MSGKKIKDQKMLSIPNEENALRIAFEYVIRFDYGYLRVYCYNGKLWW